MAEFKSQPYLYWGCMQYAMYNMFGETAFLDHPTNEVSPFHFQRWARTLGYEFCAVYCDNSMEFPSPAFYWKVINPLPARKAFAGQAVSHIFDIRNADSYSSHSVGVVFHYNRDARYYPVVEVLDSLCREPQRFSLNDFVRTRYAAVASAYLVDKRERMDELLPSYVGHEQPDVPKHVRDNYQRQMALAKETEH